jgi:two-component system copper resistance phosphate regulon response regulator CusR
MIMRALLIGGQTPGLLRIERLFLERGWRVDRGVQDEAGHGHWEVVVVERTGPDQQMQDLIAGLRRRISHDLLLVLGDFQPAERSHVLALGGDDAIPWDAPGTLVMSRLMALLRLCVRGFQDCYDVGGLRVDVSRRRVRRDGHDIRLSPREFKRMVLLAQEAGTVLPRSAIIERLWVDGLEIGDNAVDALASRLRRRLDGPFGTKMLRTVRGVGYCLAVGEDLQLAS